jgi:methylmalonyl-CoA mutase
MNTPESAAKPGRLLEEFPPVSYDAWKKVVETELKGAPFDKRMFTPTYEGITLKPIYRSEDAAKLPHLNSMPGTAPFLRGSSAEGYLQHAWDISQGIHCASPAEFNQAARNSLSKGLNALNMVLDRATRHGLDPDWARPEDVGCGGLSIATVEDLGKALDGINLETVSLFVRSGASAMPFAVLLAALLRKRKQQAAVLHGCVEMDPLGVLSHEGSLPQSLAGAYREMAALTRWAAAHAPILQTICVHSRAWHESGANAVQELAFTLATGVEYLRAMGDLELDADVVGPRVRFAMTVGENFFMEIAKLRALRPLWARAVEAFGGNAKAQRLCLHVRTSHWNKTVYDAHNNILRATVEAFAGAVGGCDSMQVGAFDEVFRQPDDFSQRLARNTQLVLQKECELAHVIDPAGGSWYVESLTADLAGRAWSLFQEIEKRGGMAAALAAGFPQQAVAATAKEKIKAVRLRRQSVVGLNQYANAREKAPELAAPQPEPFHQLRVRQIAAYRTSLEDAENEGVLAKLSGIIGLKGVELFDTAVEAALAGATLGEIVRALRIHDRPCEPVSAVRLTRPALAFEKLRAAAERYALAKGQPPRAFLCNMGELKDYKARADFARGFFAAGGYEVISSGGFTTPSDAALAFNKSKAPIAVICSTDDRYPAVVPLLTAAVRAQNLRTIVVLAGYPAEQVEAFKKAGVDEFIHVRADAVELLDRINLLLGVEA